MVVDQLIPTLRDLNRADKWLVMQFLVSELAETQTANRFDESMLVGRTFDIWSPEASIGAADALMAALAAEKELAGEKKNA